jgi:hypothetical protein
MMPRPTIALTAALSWIGAAITLTDAAHAQITVSLRDGSSVRATALSLQGATRLSLTPEGGGAARIVETSAVERVDMPQPPILAETYAALASGESIKTLQSMGKLRVELDPLKKIPGGREWWLEGEFLRAHILLSQRRTKELEEAMRLIAADNTDPVAQRRAQVFQAHLTGLAGDPRKALEELRSLILNARDPETLADAWLFTGFHRSAVNEQSEALIAFLRVPVFYPALPVPLGSARLGAARCHIALEDLPAARRVLRQLIEEQGTSPAGQEATKLLSQVEKGLGITSTATDASQ